MGYSHKVIVGVDLVEFTDSMDLYSVPDMKRIFKELIKKENKRILISMEKLKFIDSSGLGMLANLSHECKQNGVKLILAALSPEIDKIFSTTKFKENFEVYPTINEAIRAFG